MMEYGFSRYDEKTMAKARVNDAPVSIKVATQICNMIRNKTTKKAKTLLEEVVVKKRAVPFKKFNRDLAHRTGIGPGRYPIKASEVILSLIKTAESNAQNKGLGYELVITHIAANKAANQWHYGRKRRRQMKKSHVEIIVEDVETKKENKKEQKLKTEAPKTEKKAEENSEKEDTKSEDKKKQTKSKVQKKSKIEKSQEKDEE